MKKIIFFLIAGFVLAGFIYAQNPPQNLFVDETGYAIWEVPGGGVEFFDDFEGGIGNWTVVNNGGSGLWLVYGEPYPNYYTLPPPSAGNVCAADADEAFPINCDLVLTVPLDFSTSTTGTIEFDNDFNAINPYDLCYVDVSGDGGVNWDNVLFFNGVDVRETHEVIDISAFLTGQTSVFVRFRSIQPGYDGWWAIDNVHIYGTLGGELLGYNVYLDGVLDNFTSDLFYQFTDLINGQNYIAGVSAVYDYGESITIEFSFTYLGAGAGNDIPLITKLSGNYPNPFNPSTTINYSLKENSKVSINIYNIKGQRVKQLVSENLSIGRYSVVWNGTDDFGKKVSSGIYFYKLKAGDYQKVKKMILLK